MAHKPTGNPLTIDPVVAYLARLGDPKARMETAQALNEGIVYAAAQAVKAAPQIATAAVVAGVRRYLGLSSVPSDRDDPFAIPLFERYLRLSTYAESHIRGLLRETARAVVADLAHERQPRRGPFRRIVRLFTTR
jgi:hypothetical protein